MVNSLQRQCLWRHLQQLICRGRVLQAQKVLQHLPCQLQVMCSVCRLVHQQLIKEISVIDAGTGGCGQHPTSIGITPSRSSLNRISREVQIHPSPLMTCVYFVSRFPDWITTTSIRSIPATMGFELCRRLMVCMKSRCVK